MEGKKSGGWQSRLDSGDNDVMGGLELGKGGLWAGKHNKVAQRGPLCSRHPNIGMADFRGKSLIASSN
jgi:hypothetical protein